jgi:phage host-nuclease inhibitor protein Gam
MATRIKTLSQPIAVPQSKTDAMRDIKAIGDLQRELNRIEADINDDIAALTNKAAPRIDALRERITALQEGVHTWCEAHRVELCGKGKSANLVTGEVNWRKRPPSVSLSKVETVIAKLRELGLTRFIREKEEVNKDAILAEPAAVAGVKGIKVVTDVEDFVITPFEVEVGEVA